VVGLAIAARLVHGRVPPATGKLVGEVIFAVLLGLIVGNVLRIPKLAEPGIKFAFQTLLRTAIVVLGATFSFAAALSIGARAILMVVFLMTLALFTERRTRKRRSRSRPTRSSARSRSSPIRSSATRWG
jgi:uncharacterized membrane protein YadS